ncbi:MAG TPA: ABC transporter permease [Actinocrinis sp.]|nr:ABC transporter permease [Actinocrinis sp.]
MTTYQATEIKAGGGLERGRVYQPSMVGVMRAVHLGFLRGGLEIRQFYRNRPQLGFGFAMPIVMLVLLSSVFAGSGTQDGATIQQMFLSGMLGLGVLGSSFQTLAMQIGGERRTGALKRLRAMPMPRSSYFIGKTLMVLAVNFAQTFVLLAVAAAFLHVSLPRTVGAWLTFGWVYAVGITACSLLGIAYSSLLRDAQSGVMVILPMTVLQFISGAYIVFSQLPRDLQNVAAFFPLKWLCQGLRSVFLPGSFTALEPAGSWEHGRVALMLGLWAVAGMILCLTTFRWKGRDDG